MTRSPRRKRWRWIVGSALPAALAGTAALAAHLGWCRGPAGRLRPWAEATGWSRVPGAPTPSASLRVGNDPRPLRLTWLGHSGFVVEWHETRLLLDPNLSARCTVAPRRLERPAGPDDLPPVDAALVSHAHRDHLDLPTLDALARRGALPLLVLPAGTEGSAGRLRGRRVRVTGAPPGEPLRIGGLEAIAVPAVHGGARWHPLRTARPAAGWVLRAGGEALYFAGDTGYSADLFRAIGTVHRPALAVLPIGAHSPAFPVGRVHLSPEQAVAAALDLGWRGSAAADPPAVVPCHFGTFTLSLDRPDAALPRFARAADRAGLRWYMPALRGEVGAAP